jgi:serine/threonine protein kinase
MADDYATRRADEDDYATRAGVGAGARVFGRYQLESIAGRGGMGVVWKARDEELGETVALKFLPEMVTRDAAAVDELKEETRRSRQLTHPNIVRIHDFVRDDILAAVSMEFVDGTTLSQLRLQQPGKVFAVETLAPLVAQLCAALDYAHREAKVVHRDLKPANLLVTRDGKVKVTDFGIARSLTETHTRLTGRVGNTSGTMVYMSPQQLQGRKPMPADDIYALGATLYELLTGKPPFFRGDIAAQVAKEAPASLQERRVELGISGEPIPPTWEETIRACLAKAPQDRPQSATEVARRLGIGESKVEGPMSGGAGSEVGRVIPNAPNERRPTDSPPYPPKSRIQLAAAAAIVLGVAGYVFWPTSKPQGVSQTAAQPVASAPSSGGPAARAVPGGTESGSATPSARGSPVTPVDAGPPPKPEKVAETATPVRPLAAPEPPRSDYCTKSTYLVSNEEGKGVNGVAWVRWHLPPMVQPRQKIEGTVTWQFSRDTAGGGYNPNAAVNANVFGDWQPDTEMARLIDSAALGEPRAVEKTIRFRAPDRPGRYRLRWMFITGDHPNISFYGGRAIPRDNAPPGAWSEVSFEVARP